MRSDERSSMLSSLGRIRYARGYQCAAATQPFRIDCASSSLTPACVRAPTMPPVRPPVAAPAAVATSHPAATTGPTPGMAQSETGEESGGTADAGTDAGARTSAFGAVVDASRSLTRFVAPFFEYQLSELFETRLMSVRDTGRLQFAHRLSSALIVVV